MANDKEAIQMQVCVKRAFHQPTDAPASRLSDAVSFILFILA